MGKVECIYETLPGWSEDISDCKRLEELPDNARNYVRRVSELISRPVGIVSVGPGRDQTITTRTQIKGLV